MAVCSRNLRDARIYLYDATPVTPLKLLIPIDNGDLSWTVHDQSKTILNRGRLHSRRQGDEIPIDMSFTIKFTQYQYAEGSATGVSPVDILLHQGGASAWVSTDNCCGPFAVDLKFEVTDPCDITKAELLTFVKFHAETVAFKEGDDFDTITVNGMAFTTRPSRAYGALIV